MNRVKLMVWIMHLLQMHVIVPGVKAWLLVCNVAGRGWFWHTPWSHWVGGRIMKGSIQSASCVSVCLSAVANRPEMIDSGEATFSLRISCRCKHWWFAGGADPGWASQINGSSVFVTVSQHAGSRLRVSQAFLLTHPYEASSTITPVHCKG